VVIVCGQTSGRSGEVREFGETLRIPSELLTPTADPVDPAHLITELRQNIARLRPVPAARHAQRPREMLSRLPLTGRNAPSLGAHPTAAPTRSCHGERRHRNSSCKGNPSLCQRQGQARLHSQRDRQQEQLQPASHNNLGHSTTCHATTTPHNNYTLRSPHSFPRSLQSLSNSLRAGGGVMWEPPTVGIIHYQTMAR
jgi:hypothetical protein